MNSRSKNNRTQRIRLFHGLLAEAKLMHEKKNLLAGYEVESTKDLTYEELEELIKYVRSHITRKKEPSPEIRKHRSIVMLLLNDLGVYQNNNDWDQVNEFLLQPRIAGKLLYEMNVEEMIKLAKKLRAIFQKRVKKMKQENFQARNN